MSAFGDIREAKIAAKTIVDTLQQQHPGMHPMQAMAAASFALGAMVAAASELGVTKAGRSGQLLSHLFALAESSAETGLGVD